MEDLAVNDVITVANGEGHVVREENKIEFQGWNSNEMDSSCERFDPFGQRVRFSTGYGEFYLSATQQCDAIHVLGTQKHNSDLCWKLEDSAFSSSSEPLVLF